MRAAALVLGAGQGRRLGASRPKALVAVAGRSLIAWSAEALGRADRVEAIQCVLPPETQIPEPFRAPARWLPPVTGGATRQASLARGLEGLEASWPDCGWVLVHDAARCLVEPADAERVLERSRETGAAIPVLPVVDTLKEVRDGVVVRTLARSQLVRVQTPQAFRLSLLREALEKASREGFVGTDCASLVERLGARVLTCPGRQGNWKVTGPGDLERAGSVLSERGAGPRPASAGKREGW
ncbi:MAG: 2-C-methyl-D-erythritol 4-phosphate cytidylyltransferase [Myxococcota bacterium]